MDIELKPSRQFAYAKSGVKPEERIKALKEVLELTRPIVTSFEVGTIQSDILSTGGKVNWKQHNLMFEVVSIEEE